MILTMKTTGKSRGKSATAQIRHNSEKRILFFLPCGHEAIRRMQLDGPKKCPVFLRNQTARHSIYNRANSGMQSRDSLRDSPEMHCKISSSKNKQKGK